MIEHLCILLVEDSPDDAELIVLELERGGFKVVWERVENKEALKSALDKGLYDLVISDFSMPAFSASEALKIVKNFNPVLPFLIVSGAIGERHAVELMQLGAQDYILKHNLIRLCSAVSRALDEAQIKKDAIKDEQELTESNQRLKAIFNGTAEAMMLIKVAEDDLIIDSINQALYAEYKKYIGSLMPDELIGMNLELFWRTKLLIGTDQITKNIGRIRNVIHSKENIRFVDKFVIGGHVLYEEIQFNAIIDNDVCKYVLFVAKNMTESVISEQKLKEAYNEVRNLKTQLEQENRYLKEEIEFTRNFDEIIYKSDKISQVLRQVEQVAPVDSNVLISGETGTGKELIVRAIHKLSERKNQKFIKINCAALPKELIESELFGHEKGAFTGAFEAKPGRFELANKGTIFLDEIGEMPVDVQAKLLRVLQEGEFDRVGGTKVIKVDVRVIAATNKNLDKEVEKGTFRADLFYRLNVFPIVVPPLRERREDIIPLINYFVVKYGRKFSKADLHISKECIEMLKNYNWPGNVRELENIVERELIITQGSILHFEQLNRPLKSALNHNSRNKLSLNEVEYAHIKEVLESCNWKINGVGGAASKLELTPSTLRDRMNKHGIVRPS